MARQKIDVSMADFLQAGMFNVTRVPGTAVYLTSDTELVPSALFHTLKHFKVMHEQIGFLHIVTEDVPCAPVSPMGPVPCQRGRQVCLDG